MRQKQADAPPDTRKQQLMEDLRRTKCALDQAYSNFENVVDPDLIDCSIYELKAVQMRYRFLLKQAELLEKRLRDSLTSFSSCATLKTMVFYAIIYENRG